MPKVVNDEKTYRAVVQVISERGYAGATTKQMADAADFSEVTLFRKYGSKQQLVKQAISFIVKQTDFESAARYTGDVHADLTRVVQAYQESAVRHGFFFAALLSEMSRHPELADSFDEPLNIFQSIGQLVARYQTEGILLKEHPIHAIAALLGPLIYVTMMSSAAANENIPNLELSTHVDHFLAGRAITFVNNQRTEQR